MSMYNNIDMVIFHNTEIRFSLKRRRTSEHNVLEIGTNHRADPAISQCSTGTLLHKVFIILVNAHKRSVHTFYDFSINISWQNTLFFPFILQGLWCSFKIGSCQFRLTPLANGFFRNCQSYFINISVFGNTIFLDSNCHIKVGCDLNKSRGVFNLVIHCLFSCRGQKSFGNRTAMIRVSRCPTCYHSDKVTGTDGICSGTTKPFSRILTFNAPLGQGQTTRSHCAIFTAYPLQTNSTWFHGHCTIENSFDPKFLCSTHHLLCCRFHSSFQWVGYFWCLYCCFC